MSASTAVDRSNRIQLLLDHEPKADPDLIERAALAIKNARMLIAASDAVIEGTVLGACRYVPTTAVPTLAVTVGGDGLPLFLYNPDYTLQLLDGGPNGLIFVIVHEGGHLIKRHLQTPMIGRNAEVWQLATETHLNDWVQRQIAAKSGDASSRKAARAPMPRIKVTDENGNVTLEEQGVNPEKVYQKYRKDLNDQGKDPVSYDDFIKTDEACYRELMRMAKPPVKMNEKSGCQHQPGEGGSDPHELPLDEEAIDNIVGEALDHALKSAIAGDERAKRELLELEGRSEGEKAEKMIGRLGLGAFRGEKVLPKIVDGWKQHVADKMASLLEEDFRPRVNHRVEAVNRIYDLDPQIVFRGDKPLRTGLLIGDTSGSMGTHAIKWFASKCGQEEGLVLDIWAIDTQLYPVKMGTPLQGGGGTNFESVVEYCKSLQDPYDFVLMFTDGYVAPWHPHEPDKWTVLLTPDGNRQLEEQMPEVDFYHLTPEDMLIED